MPGKWWVNANSAYNRNLNGGAVVGMFDGHGELVKWRKCYDLLVSPTVPNELLNGPRYNRP
jgi:hypothetical protein